MERAVRLELTSTGFAIRRLSRLATRASWNGRRDSNSRVEFGRLACFQLHHFRGTPGRIRTRSIDVRSVALFQLSYRSKKDWSTVPDSNRCLSIGNAVSSTNWTNGARYKSGRGGQNRTVATSAQDSDASTTPHPENDWCAR